MATISEMRIRGNIREIMDAQARTDIENTQQAVTGLQGDVTNLQGNVTNIKNVEIPNLKQRTLVSERDIRSLQEADKKLVPYPRGTSKYGEAGQVLRTDGNGNTEWATVGQPTDEQTAEAVADWLENHPEAVTTVEDGSLTLEKFSYMLQRQTLRSMTINPIYVGDFMTPAARVTGCCIRIGDYFYCVEAKTRAQATAQASNSGLIRKFSVPDNIEVTTAAHEGLVGHGNSIAYDPLQNRVYIAPIWDTSGGTEAPAFYLYAYDSEMNYIGKLNTLTVAMGVSYDQAQNKLYYYDYNHKIYVYDYTMETWTHISTVDMTDVTENEVYGRSYNQDFTVYDGMFYISSPYGNIIFGEIKPITSKPIESYILIPMDSFERFFLGELEGFEFDENGHLFAISYVKLSTEVSNSFVVELPLSSAIGYSTNLAGNLFGVNDGTLGLSAATQNRFALATYYIRSMAQLACLVKSGNSTRIHISENEEVVDDYTITITDNIELYLEGSYQIKGFNVYGGQLSIFTDNDTHSLTVTNSSSVFRCFRTGQVKLCGSTALRIATPNISSSSNNLININYYYPLTMIRLLPVSLTGIDFYIGGRRVVNPGIYHGSENNQYYAFEEITTIPAPSFFNGIVTYSTRSLRITIPLMKQVPADNCNVTLTGSIVIRGGSGYLNGSEANATINLANTDYSLSYYPKGNYLTIFIGSDSAFTNITNNTTIIAEVKNAVTVRFSPAS